ncbi:DNA mismatch repair protein MSH4 [Populus alba]|uniref:DNA mismatch repair protein MSH4-like isoform X1 n=1 Tax=Populus alba TaxID=43335 RepID=A0A4U5NRJ2_POPAL|nr:DNA mismatch repair protein MSH4-like [Populus alba]TKR85604.1 DNA mismatch repair protein MSH4-like isoform X1 [Populus alba]
MEDDTGDKSSIVIGLIENRAKEVGMAAFDLRSASLHLSQYIETSSSYQNTKTLLQFYDPVVVIVPPNKFAPDGMLGVSDLVDRFYASVKKVVMARCCFDDTKGAVLIKNLAATEPSALGLDTYYKQYYLCLAAAAATIKWIEAEKGVIVTNHSLLVTFNGSFDHMSIDATSVQNLEIIEPFHSSLLGTNNKKRSLFHMLKTTKTTGGTRLLRANLLQPLKDIKTINTRLDCLDELMSNEQLFFGLSQALRKFPKEIDRILCHFCFKPKRVTNEVLGADNARRSQVLISSIILLKTALDALPLLSKALKNAKSFLLANVYKTICENEKYVSIRKRVGEVIDEDVLHARVPFVARTQQCFAVKAGIDGLLDIARRTFCDTSEAIHNLANKYREEFKLPNLKLPFNNRQGFYFSIPQKDIQGKLPSKFIQVLKHGNNIHCSTLELASLNVRNKSAAAECYIRTEVCLEALLNSIREDASALTLLAEVLCLLDMIINSFAYTISTKPVDRYTRPEFTSNGPLAIDAGRHPILESIHNDFVPNNIFLSEASNMIIVMGPNMSGKSTYLQQVCLIVILAQIGCYVPARFSTIRVVDRIFTRMGSVDNLESNSSTFMTEMKETAFIMQNVSERSLIFMDELGRATSSSDGFAIAWSCCEHLLSLKAYSIFATHMENLSELATIYPNVRIVHFHVDIKSNRLDFKFQLEDGPRHVPHYGLLLAEVAGLPSSVIEMARSITSKITEKQIKQMEVNCRQHHQLQMVYRVAQRLICLKHSSQDEDSIRQALQNLKEQYINGTL